MAQEANLSSFQESEWEVILPVLYRDRAVQNMEEERIRYAVPQMGESCGLMAFSARSMLLGT